MRLCRDYGGRGVTFSLGELLNQSRFNAHLMELHVLPRMQKPFHTLLACFCEATEELRMKHDQLYDIQSYGHLPRKFGGFHFTYQHIGISLQPRV